MKSGKGKLVYEDGALYTGEFKSDKRNGYGKMIYKSNNEYIGYWKDDKK